MLVHACGFEKKKKANNCCYTHRKPKLSKQQKSLPPGTFGSDIWVLPGLYTGERRSMELYCMQVVQKKESGVGLHSQSQPHKVSPEYEPFKLGTS